ncbi:MAG: PTPA-CTERM sorting domain-containing protein [Verrucomicrobia bacterium]|nr:PTPA-CTERM sorting domain-containing protein [Leptolyngbya sp. ES-bin-22]
MFEAFVTIWTIIILFFSGGSHGGNKVNQAKKVVPPKPPLEQAALPSSSAPLKAIPTPALLPGMVVFLGNVLRKRNKNR